MEIGPKDKAALMAALHAAFGRQLQRHETLWSQLLLAYQKDVEEEMPVSKALRNSSGWAEKNGATWPAATDDLLLFSSRPQHVDSSHGR
jgi:hypothetical protein